MKITLHFKDQEIQADVAKDDARVAIHRPLGENKDWVITHISSLNILGRVRLKSDAYAYQKRLDALFRERDADGVTCILLEIMKDEMEKDSKK